MNVNMNEFIKNNYDVSFYGDRVNREDLSSVDEFLLAESHIQPLGTQRINSLFIRQFINKESDLVLVESRPSMQPVNLTEHAQTSQLADGTQAFGWDHSDSVDQLNALEEKYPQFAVPVKCNQRLSSLIFQYLNLSEEEQNTRVSEFQPKLQEIKHDLVKAQQGVSQEDVAAYFVDLKQISGSSELFEKRTESMKETLIKAQEVANKRFLIAGLCHLVQDTESLGIQNSPEEKQAVGGFLSFLRERNAVVLLPKDRSIFYATENCLKTIEKIGSLQA